MGCAKPKSGFPLIRRFAPRSNHPNIFLVASLLVVFSSGFVNHAQAMHSRHPDVGHLGIRIESPLHNAALRTQAGQVFIHGLEFVHRTHLVSLFL